MKIKCHFLICLLLSLSSFAQTDSIFVQQLFDTAYDLEQVKPDSALNIYNRIIQLSNQEGYSIFEAKALNYKGIVYNDLGKYDSALAYYNKSISTFTRLHDKKGIAANLNNIGNTYKLQGDLTNAISNYQNSISIYEELKDDYRLSISYGNLATVFEDIGQIVNAKSNYLHSIEFAKKTNDSIQLVNNFHNLTNLYFNTLEKDSLFFYVQEAKKYLNPTSDNHLKSLVSYGEARYFLSDNKLSEAFKKASQALALQVEINNPYYIALCQSLIGNIYFLQDEFNAALKYTLEAAKVSKEYGNKSSLVSIYGQLSSIYKAKNDAENALFYKELEDNVKDQVVNENIKHRFNLLNIKYQTEKKDKEIVAQQLELQQKKTQNNYLVGSIVFLLLASILLIILLKQRQKRKNQEILTLKREFQIKTLESLIAGEEKERFRIAKELHDGVNGDLSAIKYKLSSLVEMNNIIIKEAIAMIDDSCKQVRAISHNLVPPSLENFSLLEATQEYCFNMNQVHKPQIMFQHIGDSVNISKKCEINVFRIIQELVTNSLKHSDCSEINVQISCRENTLLVTVEDDGKGFDTKLESLEGIGLKNIKSRADYLNAEFDILSNSNGSSFTLEIDKSKLNDY